MIKLRELQALLDKVMPLAIHDTKWYKKQRSKISISLYTYLKFNYPKSKILKISLTIGNDPSSFSKIGVIVVSLNTVTIGQTVDQLYQDKICLEFIINDCDIYGNRICTETQVNLVEEIFENLHRQARKEGNSYLCLESMVND